MAEENSQEKTESPTQKKKDDAREEGQVAFSKELSGAALLGGFLAVFYMMGTTWIEHAADILSFIFNNFTKIQINSVSIKNLFSFFLSKTAFFVLPIFFTTIIIGLFASVLQVGIHFSLKPLVPKLDKVDPIAGFGRIFSKQSFAELLKSLFKMGVIGYIGYSTFSQEVDPVLNLVAVDTKTLIFTTFSLVGLFCFRVFLALAAMAAFDFIFQRWDLEQKLKMSKQDIKEEMKQVEGDPQIKARIRQIQQKMSQARMMQEVPNADVLLTNPIHFAIALQYNKDDMQAPKVIAKGMDFLALRMIEIAKKSNVLTYQNPPLARSLYSQVEIGDEIPEDFYKAVAEILAFVYRSKKK